MEFEMESHKLEMLTICFSSFAPDFPWRCMVKIFKKEITCGGQGEHRGTVVGSVGPCPALCPGAALHPSCFQELSTPSSGDGVQSSGSILSSLHQGPVPGTRLGGCPSPHGQDWPWGQLSCRVPPITPKLDAPEPTLSDVLLSHSTCPCPVYLAHFFLRALPLQDFGTEWPFSDKALLLTKSLEHMTRHTHALKCVD